MNEKFRLACLPKHGTDHESWTFFKIAGTLPVKTRLPFAAWVIAGLVTIYSFMASLVTPALIMRSKQALPHQRPTTHLSQICSKYCRPFEVRRPPRSLS